MTEKEATGEETNAATLLFDPRNLVRLEQTIQFQKEVADLCNKMQPKKKKRRAVMGTKPKRVMGSVRRTRPWPGSRPPPSNSLRQ